MVAAWRLLGNRLVRICTTFSLLLLAYHSYAVCDFSGGDSSNFGAFKSSDSAADALQQIKTVGRFVDTGITRKEQIKIQFKRHLEWRRLKKNLLPEVIAHAIKVESADLSDTLSLRDLESLRNVSDQNLLQAAHKLAIKEIEKTTKENELLRPYGYLGVAPLYHIKGFAGLWTRGGGSVVKGLVPFNLAELLTESEANDLLRSVDLFKSTQDENAAARIRAIIEHASQKDNALNSVLITLLQAAILSEVTQAYFVTDLWTSAHTHKSIADYLQALPDRLQKIRFHENEHNNQLLRNVLRNYLHAGRVLGETNLFGYQMGVHPLYEDNGVIKFETSLPSIGEGAGTYPSYLAKTGRAAELAKLGVQDTLFSNAEVIAPIEVEYLLFKAGGNPVGVGAIPRAPTDEGGSFQKLTYPGEAPRLMMLEDSMVDESVRNSAKLYNINNVYMHLSNEGPTTIGFEPVRGTNFWRGKLNAGDVTMYYPATLLLGQRGINYVTLKHYKDYLADGTAYVQRHIRLMLSALATDMP